MENKTYFATFAFYDEKGRRLSIFGEQIADSISIAIITCSKQDMFSKKKGRALYEMWEEGGRKHPDIHPITANFTLKDKTKPMREFIEWCRENYYSQTLLPISILGAGIGLVKGENLLHKDFMESIIKTLR
jgi:hypothetical protein